MPLSLRHFSLMSKTYFILKSIIHILTVNILPQCLRSFPQVHKTYKSYTSSSEYHITNMFCFFNIIFLVLLGISAGQVSFATSLVYLYTLAIQCTGMRNREPMPNPCRGNDLQQLPRRWVHTYLILQYSNVFV